MRKSKAVSGKTQPEIEDAAKEAGISYVNSLMNGNLHTASVDEEICKAAVNHGCTVDEIRAALIGAGCAAYAMVSR